MQSDDYIDFVIQNGRLIGKKEVIPNPSAILDLFSSHFHPPKTIRLEDKISNGNDIGFIAILERS